MGKLQSILQSLGLGWFFQWMAKRVAFKDRTTTDAEIEISGQIKVDRMQDKFVRNEPKELLGYITVELFKQDVNEEKDLYWGSKEVMENFVDKDPADVLTKAQSRGYRKEIKRNKYDKFFILHRHPKTIHKKVIKD